LRVVEFGVKRLVEVRFRVAFFRSKVLPPVVPIYFVEVTNTVEGQMLFPAGMVQFLASIVTFALFGGVTSGVHNCPFHVVPVTQFAVAWMVERTFVPSLSLRVLDPYAY
jgi:hypothetical protein